MPAADQTAQRRHLLTILLAFAAIYIIWSTTYLAIRVAVETIPPFFMAAVRFILAGGLVFVILRARGAPLPSAAQWRAAAVVGTLLIFGGNGLVTWSEREIPSSIAAIVVATMPMWLALFNWLFFDGGRPGRRVNAGLALGFVGIILLVGPAQLAGATAFDWPSLLVLLLAPVLWSLGSLQSRRANLPANVFMATAMEMLVGGFVLVGAGLLTGEAGQVDLAAISTPSLLAMLYLTIFGSIVALNAYIWLLQNVPPARAATYTYVNPIIAVFLGWLILNEPITPLTLVAVVVIVLAVVLINSQRRRAAAPAEAPRAPRRRLAGGRPPAVAD